MIMNVPTELPSAYSESMISWPCPSVTKAAIASSSGLPLLYVPTKPERLSSHGGKRSLANILREREQADPAFSTRMAQARKLLADEIHDVSPEDSFSKRRLMKGLSQQSLASILGTSQSHVAKIEAGKVTIYFDTAIKLAKALDLTLNDVQKMVEQSKTSKLIISAS